MEINKKNANEVIFELKQRGYLSLSNELKEVININEEEYPEGGDFGTDKGYGIKIYIVRSFNEFISLKEENGLFGLCHEIDKSIKESNGKKSHYLFYTIGAENGIVIFSFD